MKKLIFFVIIISFSVQLFAQHPLAGIVIDGKTGEPIPFVNIVFEAGVRGTVSGIDGRFSIERKNMETSIKVSCLGYEPAVIEIPLSDNFVRVKLVPKQYELSQVTVYPGENPALTLMKKVFEHRDKNNADVATDYKCLIYHKFNYSIDTEKLSLINSDIDSIDKKKLENMHVLLIESVSEKKHIAPDKNNERIISGRTSGFEDPILSTLPAQMQSFTFYNDYVKLLDNIYMNPVSKAGLQRYLFLPEDTLIDARGDTLYYISFRPRKNSNIKGMEGSMHIHVPSYGIKTVNAQVSEKSFDFSIKQTYQYVDDKQWFPENLESRLDFYSSTTARTSSSSGSVIYAQSKSTITAIELNPKLSKKEFSAITLIDETYKENQPIEKYRIIPLTAKDSATYHIIDSLLIENKFDKIFVNVFKGLIDGFIPFGFVKLELDKTIDFNQYDGFKLGAGLWTSDKVMRNLSVGGFYYRSFKSKDHNYGAGMKLNISKKAASGLRFQWEKRNMAIGTVSFLDSKTSFMIADFSNYLTKIMDITNSINASFTTRILKYFKTNLYYNYSEVTPTKVYPFLESNDNQVSSSFSFQEYGIKLRWAHKETFTYMYPFGLQPNGTNMPYFWTNLSFGNGKEIENFEYAKLEAQFEKQFRLYESFKSIIRINGGNIWGDVPMSKLYSLFGLNIEKSAYNLEMTNYFNVMRPNEFAANSYINVFWRNTFYTRLNKQVKFKPDITIITAAGWGEIKGNYSKSVKSYNKGYYESGIYVGLFNMLFFKYGIGVYHRYGPYSLPKTWDNWAITLGLGGAF